nr:hypothetical protein [Tanacetum cinerariifolium]
MSYDDIHPLIEEKFNSNKISKKCTWSRKGQELEATGIMWCADHNFYNHTTDFVSGKEELALLCVRMFLEESEKIERYVGGLPDMIHESVVASKPKTMQEAIEMATKLMDKKIRTFIERQTKTKRKQGDNQQQQQQNKR